MTLPWLLTIFLTSVFTSRPAQFPGVLGPDGRIVLHYYTTLNIHTEIRFYQQDPTEKIDQLFANKTL